MNTTQYVIARNGGVGIGASGSLGHNARWKSTDRNQQIDYQKIIIKSIKSYLKDRDKAFQDEFENYIKNDVISAYNDQQEHKHQKREYHVSFNGEVVFDNETNTETVLEYDEQYEV